MCARFLLIFLHLFAFLQLIILILSLYDATMWVHHSICMPKFQTISSYTSDAWLSDKGVRLWEIPCSSPSCGLSSEKRNHSRCMSNDIYNHMPFQGISLVISFIFYAFQKPNLFQTIHSASSRHARGNIPSKQGLLQDACLDCCYLYRYDVACCCLWVYSFILEMLLLSLLNLLN